MINKLKNNEIFAYLFSSGVSFGTDIVIFYILVHILNFLNDLSVVVAAIIARCASSFINYFLNRNYVFKKNNSKAKVDKKTLIQYYILVIIQLAVSTSLVLFFKNVVKIDVTIIKVCIDVLIFVVNYVIQKIIIFKKQN